MELTTGQIAEQLGGLLEGDPSLVIRSLSTVDAQTESTLAFVNNTRFANKLYDSSVTAVLVSEDFAPEQAVKPALIRVEDPYKAFIRLLIEHYSNGLQPSGIDPNARIAATATLGKDVFIAAGATIADGASIADGAQVHVGAYIGPGVSIGTGSVVQANATIHRGCVVGANCRIHSGAVIGSDGFGYTQLDGRLQKVPQIGNVVIKDDVEIGANSTIDRATIGSTVIGRGTKIDNLVHLAHNIEIGEFCILAGQVGIAGSVKIGNGVILGGQAGITGHVELADGVQVSAKSGLSKSVTTPGTKLRGYPARELNRQLKLEAMIGRLPEILDEIRQLQKQVEQLKQQLPPDESNPDA